MPKRASCREVGGRIEKECTICLEYKGLDDFAKHGVGLHGRSSQCKACRCERAAKFKLENADRVRAYYHTPEQVLKRRIKNLEKFGLTPEDYDRMLAEQGGVCAICRGPESGKAYGGGVKRLAVDHCHATGLVRGLLCGNCNKGLGNLGDSPERMREAARYVEGALAQ